MFNIIVLPVDICKGFFMAYDHMLDKLITMAIEEDLGQIGDVTSIATMPDNPQRKAKIMAKADGVVAGLEIIRRVYTFIDETITVKPLVQDGDSVVTGTVVCEISGSIQSLLSGERIALNFLQRLSGIATLSRQFVSAIEGTRAVILDTRKTTPSWRALEKYAVHTGGAQNHRMGLYDMVLIKDNHIDAAGSITNAVSRTRAYPSAEHLLIEVEVKDLSELREALALNVDRILLDNMSLEQMREAVHITDGKISLEASGNVSLETVHAIAETGVDYISSGALTHSAPILDLSMLLYQSIPTTEEA